MQGPEARTLRAIEIEKLPLGKHQARPGGVMWFLRSPSPNSKAVAGTPSVAEARTPIQTGSTQRENPLAHRIDQPRGGLQARLDPGFQMPSCLGLSLSALLSCVGWLCSQAGWSLLVAKAARGSSSRTLCLSHCGGGGTPRGQPRSYHRDRKDGPGPVRASVVMTDIRGRVRANLDHVGCFPETGLP